MKEHVLRAYGVNEALARENELAWIFAKLAASRRSLDADAVLMVKNRIIDNASVAIAALNDPPVVVAREMALAHPGLAKRGAPITGLSRNIRVSAEWAAWANGTAVRQLDYHDTFLARDYSHPGDNIPPIQAVAQNIIHHPQRPEKLTGEDFIRSILTGYEIQVALVKGIALHTHAIDHIAHLGVSVAAALGTLLSLKPEHIYQAIQQALHVTITTRQSRKGAISSWKAYAPAHAGKLAIEAVDRSMRGERAPSPIYEGEDSVIAWILDGKDARYKIELPADDMPFCGILETYTKEHSAEYQAQAIIDLAFEIRKKIQNLDEVQAIILHTSHHTHKVIGTGSGDPQKFDPKASRETLDHSIMYIFAVALEDGTWHHLHSYTPERAERPSTIKLWGKISTCEDAHWTERYHAVNPREKAFGARVEIKLNNGTTLFFEKAVANAHPNGEHPFQYEQYLKKFRTLTEGILPEAESERFLDTVNRLEHLTTNELLDLHIEVPSEKLISSGTSQGLF